MSDKSWLRRRAEAVLDRALSDCLHCYEDGGVYSCRDCNIAVIETVAREYAERAVRWGVPRFYDVTSDDTVAEIIAAADKDEQT